jgi:hypothetical protein
MGTPRVLPGANQIDLFMHFLGYDHRRGGFIWTRFLLVITVTPIVTDDPAEFEKQPVDV